MLAFFRRLGLALADARFAFCLVIVFAVLSPLSACSGGTAAPSPAAQASGVAQQAALAACQLYDASLVVLTGIARADASRARASRWLQPDTIATIRDVEGVLGTADRPGLCTASTPAEGIASTIMVQVTRLLRAQATAQARGGG